MAYLDGDNGGLKVASGNTFVDFASFKSMNIDTSADSYDSTTWADTYKTALRGKSNFNVSAEFVAKSETLATLLTTLANSSAQNYRVTPHTVSLANVYYTGGMYISGGLSVAQGSAMSGSVTLVAANTITLTVA